MRRVFFLVAVVLVAAVGCSKSEEAPVRSPEVVRNAVAALAETLPGAVGSTEPLSSGEPRVSPCSEDEGRFSVQGSYQIMLVSSRHRPSLQALRNRWRADGWTDVEYREFGAAGERAELSGVSPDEGFDVRLTSGTPPRGFAVLIVSPCYAR